MKTIQCIKIISALIAVGLISCSAMNQNSTSPTERLISAIRKGQNFHAKGETFEKEIILHAITTNMNSYSSYIKSELVFEECTFKGKIELIPEQGKSLYFQKEVIFEGCEFQNEVAINDASFNARFQMGSNLARQSLDLQRNSFKEICRVDENEIGQDLILQYSHFHESLSLFGNSMGRHLFMQGISVNGKSQLGNTNLYGSIDISNSNFHDDFNMDYAKKGKKLLAGNSKFFGNCNIKAIEDFSSVDLSSSVIFGKYLFSSAHELSPNVNNTVFYLKNNE